MKNIDIINPFFHQFVFGWIYHDIDAAIDGKANLLAALGLLAYTEFMGSLVTGEKKSGSSKKNFVTFFERLDLKSLDPMARRAETRAKYLSAVDVYKIFRCGLVHNYFTSQRAVINMGWIEDQPIVGACDEPESSGEASRFEAESFPISPFRGAYIFQVPPYFIAFKRACEVFHRQALQENNPNILNILK